MSAITIPSSCPLKASPSMRSPALIKGPSSLAFMNSNVSKAFGLKSSSGFRATSMAVYKVKLIRPNGEENEIEVPDDQYILDTGKCWNGADLLLQSWYLLYLCWATRFRISRPIRGIILG